MNLRNQGNDRTLVLIDGRRTVPNQYSSNGISLNTIPTPFIRRVEIITGGSSAAYGSDAIAGVVNIITQHGQGGSGALKPVTAPPAMAAVKKLSVDVQYGTNFANGRGYLFFGATYDDQQGNRAPYDRELASDRSGFRLQHYAELCNEMQVVYVDDDGELEDGDRCLRDIQGGPEVWRNRSDGIAGGVFEERSSSTKGYWYDESGLRDDWNEEQYGIHTQQFVQLKVPEDRYASAFKTSYEL